MDMPRTFSRRRVGRSWTARALGVLVLISFIVSGTLRECISGIMHTLHWRCGERRSGDRVRVAVGPHFFAVRSTGAAICVKPCTLTLNPPPPPALATEPGRSARQARHLPNRP